MPRKTASPPDSPELKRYKRKARNDFARLFPALVLLLKARGVAKVVITYSGGGDSGQIDDVAFVNAQGELVRFDDDAADAPNVVVAQEAGLVANATRSSLMEKVTKAFDDRMNGSDVVNWYDNDGGGGELTIDVETGKLKADHYYHEQVTHNANFKGWGNTKGESA